MPHVEILITQQVDLPRFTVYPGERWSFDTQREYLGKPAGNYLRVKQAQEGGGLRLGGGVIPSEAITILPEVGACRCYERSQP
ncbi:MAG: hypothetical protein IPO08_21255 [Xanthomonadales bacterium]|nr:hypothetical protein [Xanthomonadales bacterium]